MSEKISLTLHGTLFWAKVQKPVLNEDSGKEEYRLDISLTDKKVIKTLEELKVPIKNKDKELKEEGKSLQGTFVSCKSFYKPAIVDSKLQPIAADVLLGNGTKAIVKVNVYTYTPRKKSQTGAGLGVNAIQVIDLVEYHSNSDSLEGLTAVEGFDANPDSEEQTIDDGDF